MYTLALITLLALGSSQALRFGKCPDLKTVENFDPSKYIGTWYEIESFGNLFERIANKCPKATYTAEGDHIVVKNQGISPWTGKANEFNAIGVADGDISKGKLKVEFKGPLGVNISAPYWVLATDYDSYAIVWSCVQLPGLYVDASWIMTRERTEKLTDKVSAIVDVVLQDAKISRERYVDAKQANCTN